MEMSSRLDHHEIIQNQELTMIFIIFGNQRHLKSELFLAFTKFG